MNTTSCSGRRGFLQGCLTLGSGLALGCAPDFQLRRLNASSSRQADVLVIFITGFSDDFGEVIDHGVIDQISREAGPVDLAVIQGETPQFFSGELPEQLDRRVVDTPWARSYAKRILLGFSGGGTAALSYIDGRPDAVDGLILYAPYLGPEYIIKEIEAAGGLAAWQPDGPLERQEQLWVWLRRYGAGEIERPPLHVLWSREDEVSVGLPLLEAHLPKSRLVVGHGTHGWEAFDQMWPDFVRTHRALFRK